MRPDAMPHNFRYEQLLQSIVEEAAALARLVNQAMKTQKIAQSISGQFTPDGDCIQRSLASVYITYKKEELLIKKMRLVFDAQKNARPYFQEPRID